MRFELGPPVSWMNGLHGSGPRKKLGLWILPHQQLSIITTLPQKQNLLSAHQTGGSTNLVADLDGKFWSRRQSPKKNSNRSTVLKHSSWGTRFGMNQSRSHSVFILRYHPFRRSPPVTFQQYPSLGNPQLQVPAADINPRTPFYKSTSFNPA